MADSGARRTEGGQGFPRLCVQGSGGSESALERQGQRVGTHGPAAAVTVSGARAPAPRAQRALAGARPHPARSRSAPPALGVTVSRRADSDPPPGPLPPPPPAPPPAEPGSAPAAQRYPPALPAPPECPERAAGLRDPPAELPPRRRGADALPPPPPPGRPSGQEVAAAGDCGEGPRRPPEAAALEAAARKGGPGEPEAGAGREGERRGAGDQPETRSVCSSRSSSSGGGDQRAGHPHQHHQPICKICFQGAEQGELLNPCRCDGSVRYTHQLCLLKWISERGSWTCELCCYRYHVIAIKMKQPCQWQSISITLVEKVQMIAVILGSLFLIASVTWLLWSAFSPYAVWQRKDILFQICYGMYGFMDLVCIGLIVHEGAAVYRVFKRWRAVNLHWDVLNYDKATDIEESSRGESSTSRTLWLPLTALRNRNLVHPTQLTSPRFQCGYMLLHLFNRMRTHEDLSEDNSSGEVVMRVTSV
ncbi:E3 ubiquitin-protein ligase MARCHF11 [Talpa occidentalis]|uniref:E3 ubiquitin-protein ligase MARCHF11 n=1 Tax=Talpa occidentalis TaxID=50954 RepID=UPI00188E0290|nr:E3 ubiquitin-protein ligase MARCHF11 [Talpa occidentalis]